MFDIYIILREASSEFTYTCVEREFDPGKLIHVNMLLLKRIRNLLTEIWNE